MRLILLLPLFLCFGVTAQYTHPTAGIQSEYVGACVVMDCGPFTYTDNGGPSGNYSNDVNLTYRTFCPAMAGRCMQATINGYSIESGRDFLQVKNGPTQNSPEFSSHHVPTNYSGTNGITGTNTTAVLTYTSTDASGCLTFRFYSDGLSVSSGWNATLQCVPCAGGPTGLENSDCINATAICSNAPINALSNGPGLISEYCNGTSCPAGGENFSNWYQFMPQSSGTLSINISPSNPADDFDFYIFQASSCSSLGDPIRCSDSGVTGSTGATGTSGASNTDLIENVSGNGVVAQLNVVAGQRYYLVVDKWSPVGTAGYTVSFAGTASLDCIILGVDMLSFDLEYQPDLNVVDLTWLTSNEDNMSHYDVERSVDGVNYEVISRVKAIGNTNYETQYIVVDEDPFPGVNYYRINMHDFNGESKHSELRAVNILEKEYDILSVFPNPITTLTEVIFNSYSKENAQLKITDANGKQLTEQIIPVSKGGNKLKLDLNDYKNGVYIIEIVTKYKIHRAKVVKN